MTRKNFIRKARRGAGKAARLLGQKLIGAGNAAPDFHALYASLLPGRVVPTDDASGVVFSMDRAVQLHALLVSWFAHAAKPAPLTVLYRATSERHERAYAEALAPFADRDVRAVRQLSRESFRPQLLDILRELDARHVFFLVDDIVFTEPFDLGELTRYDSRDYVPSLRLGDHLTRCYTLNADQPLPPFETDAETDRLVWRWLEGVHDWNYPLSVDGHLFSLAEMRLLIEGTDFNSPNTLEGGLQKYREFFLHRRGVAYRKSRLVNVPANKVQQDNQNLHGNVHQDDLLAEWERGLAIDPRPIYGLRNVSCHQELEFRLAPRGKA